MKRFVWMATVVALVVSFAALTLAGDCGSCKIAKSKNGWCEGCNAGFAGDQVVKSKKLHEVLNGHAVPAEKTKAIECGGCKTGLANCQPCEGCDVYFVNGRVYTSKYAAALARGQKMEWPEEKYAGKVDKATLTKDELLAKKAEYAKMKKAHVGCKGCSAAMQSAGWCSDCSVGFVGSYAYKDKLHYKQAKAASLTVMRAKALAEKCEACAVGMLTDGSCSSCKLTFKNGKKIRL